MLKSLRYTHLIYLLICFIFFQFVLKEIFQTSLVAQFDELIIILLFGLMLFSIAELDSLFSEQA